ncbi:MAG: DctP family TRAP transporter solute-binding subunit [Magnetococcales bacterium]|nr:DctP family TRAP transporter solute-binding subunit [Magnetococcales bacterium]
MNDWHSPTRWMESAIEIRDEDVEGESEGWYGKYWRIRQHRGWGRDCPACPRSIPPNDRPVLEKTKMKLFKLVAIGAVFLLIAVALIHKLVHYSMAPAVTLTPSRSAAAAITTLELGHNSPEDSALHEAARRFAAEVNKKSGGNLRVKLHPAQELGNDDQMLEMTRQGRLALLLIPTAKLSPAVPAMQLVDLPFYFPTRDALYQLLDGELGGLLLEKLRPVGLEGLAFWENGFKQFTADRPIRRPEDFHGLKIRTMKSRLIMHHFETMGSTPILIDFHSTRQALADKVVDGQENPLVAIATMKFYQVQSHLTISNHGYLGYVLAASHLVMRDMPAEARTLLLTTARELVSFERQETQRREQQWLETLRHSGVEIHTLTESERLRFIENAAHLPRQFEAIIGPDVISKAEESLFRQQQAAKPAPVIVVGMDSDLSSISVRGSLAIKQGALLAMDEINASGGVLGRPLRLICRDNRAIPSIGLKNFQELAAMPDVVAIMSGTFSSIAQLQARAAQTTHIVDLVPWAAAAKLVHQGPPPNYTFRVSANDETAAPFLIRAATQKYGQVALVLENSLWGRGNEESMIRSLKERNQAPTHVAWVDRGENDWATILDRIRQSGAQVIVLVTNVVEGAGLVKEMINQAARGQPTLPIISHWGLASGHFISMIGPLPETIDLQVLQTFSFAHLPTPRSNRVLEGYKRSFFPNDSFDMPSDVGVAQAYDLIHLLAQAIAKAGTTDRIQVRNALESLEGYDGLIKHYSPPFSPERHDALDPGSYFLARFNRDGKLVAVNP